ncbi:MAG: glucose-6-phosphate dehydrogenase [Deltaproteobacteria bacterium SG8_13]|nr:MAG: glucose-6-phosphate dehydrogenase [Deltaproteobacteria bacterium SG8_13]
MSTGEPSIPLNECAILQRSDPCLIVIFGATGDLTARKLIPALFNLYRSQGLPESFAIVGCGRTQMDDPQFRDHLEAGLTLRNGSDRKQWETFRGQLYYQPIVYDDPQTYASLAQRIDSLDRRHSTRGNKIFYLALPPSLYEPVAQMIGKAGLNREQGGSWARLVVEKPFGRDLKTAENLDRNLHRYFTEHQVFRIDHYLAKETVQNVLMFRFANAIFEPLWNRRYIDSIDIMATETLGVEHRSGYYEQAGVLRDMFQNHMLQLLALTAMEPPSRFEADWVRDERVKVFRSLRAFPADSMEKSLVLGQYAAGVIDGKPVPAYRKETGVHPESITPTYAKMRVYVDNWRWQGVPFYLTSGKRLAEKITRITIQFKEVPHSMFRPVLGESIRPNRLILGISPEENISLTFQTKTPGARVCLRSVTMDFHYQHAGTEMMLDAYEKVLIDCMLGDQMLFWRQDAVELCWSFLTPILTACETCRHPEALMHFYQAGSWGPPEAAALVES